MNQMCAQTLHLTPTSLIKINQYSTFSARRGKLASSRCSDQPVTESLTSSITPIISAAQCSREMKVLKSLFFKNIAESLESKAPLTICIICIERSLGVEPAFDLSGN